MINLPSVGPKPNFISADTKDPMAGKISAGKYQDELQKSNIKVVKVVKGKEGQITLEVKDINNPPRTPEELRKAIERVPIPANYGRFIRIGKDGRATITLAPCLQPPKKED